MQKYDSFLITFKNTSTGSQRAVRFQIGDDQLSQNWARLHKGILRSQSHLEKNYLLHGWLTGPRNIRFLCEDLNRHIEIINNFFKTKPKGLYYHIAQRFDPSTINQHELNLIHHDFELLIGQVWDVAEYFVISPPDVRYSIRQLNNLCHESEALLGSQYAFAEGRCSAAIIGSIFPRAIQDLSDEDKKRFQLFFNFGDVRLHYAQLGKTHLEAYYAQDEVVHDKNLSELKYLTGEFDICLSGDLTSDIIKSETKNFSEWLTRKGVESTGPFGFPVVAQLDRSQFKSPEPISILQELFQYDDICELAITQGTQRFSKKFSYHWSDDGFASTQMRMSGVRLKVRNLWQNLLAATFYKN